MSKKSGARFRSIKVKLVAILLLVCLVPIVLSALYTYNKTSRLLSEDFQTSTTAVIKEINRGIDSYFLGCEGTLNLLAESPILKNVNSDNGDANIITQFLKDGMESRNDILQVYFSQPNENFVIYPKVKMASNFVPTERPWYQNAINKSGKVAYTDPYKSAADGKTIISMSRTVENNGKLIGVVSMNIDLEALSKSLAKIKIGQNGYVFVTDSKGIMIAHSNQKLLGGNIVTTLSYWNKAKTSQSGFEKYTYNNSTKYAVYNTNSNTGWKIVASVPEEELLSKVKAIKTANITIFIIIAIIGSIIAIFVGENITSKIVILKNAFEKASEGDLTVGVTIKSRDEFEELGNNFNVMMGRIGELVLNVKASSDTIFGTSNDVNRMAAETSNAVGEVAVSIDQVANGASETAQDIQSSVEEVNNLAVKIDTIDNLSNKMISISGESNKLSKEGLRVMSLLISKTEKNIEYSKNAAAVVSDMKTETGKISSITDTINEIADQTNLLALNAAIEAARAGEAGKGFSVVADEIRKLAEQSTSATSQIQELISAIKDKTNSTVKSMKLSNSIAEEQSKTVEETRDIFGKILKSIDEIVEEIRLVQKASIETNKAKTEIIGRMQNMSAVSEESSASAEEVSAAAEEVTATMNEFTNSAASLAELSSELEKQINKFKV